MSLPYLAPGRGVVDAASSHRRENTAPRARDLSASFLDPNSPSAGFVSEVTQGCLLLPHFLFPELPPLKRKWNLGQMDLAS